MDKESYYIINENKVRIYFIDGKEVGEEFPAVKYIMLKEKVSSSKAHKIIKKIKETKQSK